MDTTVLLVHGAFHGAWCWSKVLAGLEARGVAALAIDLPGHGASRKPLGGLSEDAAELREVLAGCPGRVVLCGHSYGGAVITEAVEAAHPVAHLVYLAAIVPDRGENLGAALPAPGTAPIAAALLPADGGALRIDPLKARELFYHDCDPELARWAAAQLGPEHPGSFEAAASRAAWRGGDSTYVLCDEDRALGIEVQEHQAKRCARTVRWPTGHSPMLSRPELVVELLAGLAD